jgi:hypothetical protein
MSKAILKTAEAPKNKPRGQGSKDSVLVLSVREQALLGAIEDNGFSLRELLRVALHLEETHGHNVVPDLSSLKSLAKGSKPSGKKAQVSQTSDESELESKDDTVLSRAEVVKGRGQTRRTRIKEGRKVLLGVLASDSELVPLDQLKPALERLVWLQSSKDWDVLSQNSQRLKEISGPKLDLILRALGEIDLSLLSEAKTKAVMASVSAKGG